MDSSDFICQDNRCRDLFLCCEEQEMIKIREPQILYLEMAFQR